MDPNTDNSNNEIHNRTDTPGKTEMSLTQFQVEKQIDGVIERNPCGNLEQSLSASRMSVDYAMKSFTLRDTFTWDKTHTYGKRLYRSIVPFGLILKNKNMQNNMFNSFIYWRGQVKVRFQFNGNPFQAGLAIAYFRPLAENPCDTQTCTTLNHVKMNPSSGNLYEMTIPFRFPRNYLNTNASTEKDESLGYLEVVVISPLSTTDSQKITGQIFVSFPDSEFKIPKPANFVAQGNVINRTSNSNTYSNCTGTMMAETNTEPTTEMKQSGRLDVGMDKPFLASGAVPTLPTFQGMSKGRGVEYTTSVQLAPEAVLRDHEKYFGEEPVTNFAYLAGLESILSVSTISTSQTVGTNIFYESLALPFNMNITDLREADSKGPTLLDAIADMFSFWRGDFVFSFRCVRTKFHSLRLRLAIAYGASSAVTYDDSSQYYNVILNFTGDNDVCEVRVPYQAATELLRVRDGPAAPDQSQDYSLGQLSLFVLNPLVAPDSVKQSVELVTTIRMENPKFYVPRSNGYVGTTQWILQNTPKDVAITYSAQGNETEGSSTNVDEDPHTISVMGGQSKDKEVFNPKGLERNHLLEYSPKDLLDVYRRHTMIPLQDHISIGKVALGKLEGAAVELTDEQGVLAYNVNLRNKKYNQFFAGYRGGVKFRITAPCATKEIVSKGHPNTYVSPKNMKIFYTPQRVKSRVEGEFLTLGMYPYNNIWCANAKVLCTRTDAGDFEAGGDPAIEISYVMNNNYIEFTIPFQSHMNFERTENTFGTILIMGFPSDQHPEIYVAASDDFRYGLYRGTTSLKWMPPLAKKGSTIVVTSAIGALAYQGTTLPQKQN